jgi:hypothetical protein
MVRSVSGHRFFILEMSINRRRNKMANDNVQMWTELGIDLKSHNLLLNALGPVFQEIYLSQKNRPQGMGFFDFVVGDIHGIRVKELRGHAKNGGKVVATYCVFVPEEIVWAAGAIPPGPSFRYRRPRPSCPGTPAH